MDVHIHSRDEQMIQMKKTVFVCFLIGLLILSGSSFSRENVFLFVQGGQNPQKGFASVIGQPEVINYRISQSNASKASSNPSSKGLRLVLSANQRPICFYSSNQWPLIIHEPPQGFAHPIFYRKNDLNQDARLQLKRSS